MKREVALRIDVRWTRGLAALVAMALALAVSVATVGMVSAQSETTTLNGCYNKAQ